jgi:ProQ/FINO family
MSGKSKSDGRIADIATCRSGLLEILEEMQPMTVRQLFYQGVVRGLFYKSELGYNRVWADSKTMRLSGEVPYDWLEDNTRSVSRPRGASRIDLQGKEVSTVTEQEYRNAQKKIREDKQNLTARNLGSSTRTVASLHDAGRIPDDQLKKLDAPMPVAPKKSPAPAPVSESASTSAPELTRLYEALNAANTMLAGASDPALRSAMTSAALGVVIKEAQRVIDSFRESDDT